MIKKYKQFINEGLLDKLTGPSKEEVWNNYKDLDDEQLLKLSAKNGYIEGVEEAIKRGVDLECNYGYALVNASKNGHIDIVKLLLDNGADVAGYKNQYYALTVACIDGYLDIVKLLIEAGSDVNAEGGHPLAYAAFNGHMEIVKYLLENGANPLIAPKVDGRIETMNAAKWAEDGEHDEIKKYLEEVIKKYKK